MRRRVAAAGIAAVMVLVAACSSAGTGPGSSELAPTTAGTVESVTSRTAASSSVTSRTAASSTVTSSTVTSRTAASSTAASSTAANTASPASRTTPGTTGSGSGVAVTGIDIAPTATAAAFDGDGDLWPNCWAADGDIYTAHGDGKGFGSEFSDIGADIVRGNPNDLTGETTAIGDQVAQVWSGDGYTRKPTGIACVGDTLYLAVQDLATDFNQAPAASISTSTDHGRTWTWDTTAPMFSGGEFTTIFFLDYGKGYAESPDGFVYAYGLDHNWRDSYTDVVPDPVDLYLARVPKDRVAERTAWEFYAGGDGAAATWSADIHKREPVLHDARRVVTHAASGLQDLSVLSQGGVVYDAPLRTYLYTSWTEYSFETYSAPYPWGPWKRLGSRDFGPYPWSDAGYGGYATTIPSKFISADGRRMWMQSDVCPCASAGISVYYFSLRKVTVQTGPATGGDR
jgi:hypothetical protein